MNNVRFVGLDVHAETIAAAVAEVNGEVRSLGIIPNRPESLQWRAAAATRRTSARSSPTERCRDRGGCSERRRRIAGAWWRRAITGERSGTPLRRLCKKSAHFGRFAKIPVIGRWRVFF